MKVFILRWNPEISSFKKKSHNRILMMLKKETCLSAQELEPLFSEID